MVGVQVVSSAAAQVEPVIEPAVSSGTAAPQTSFAGGAPRLHAPHSQVVEQVRAPVQAPTVQLSLAPCTQANVSSAPPTQSSSSPLHTSTGGTHVPHSQFVPPQVCSPTDEQLVVQLRTAPSTQANVSSGPPTQSSSSPLHVSAGGVHVPQVQDDPQVSVPVVEHEVVQLRVAARTQSKPLSAPPTQSSSSPLQISDGGVHVPQTQVSLQVRLPVDAQLVVHSSVNPRMQAKPLSGPPTQSSSSPLQISTGGTQVPHSQAVEQVRRPVVLQVVVQVWVAATAQVKPLSAPSTQSSSRPLQTSAGGVQAVSQRQATQAWVPVVEQLVVQERGGAPSQSSEPVRT